MPPSPPGSAGGRCNRPSALRGQGPGSAPAGTRAGTHPRHPGPCPHPVPVTVKHLVQLLPDEPLDLVVIHHIALRGHEGTRQGPRPPRPSAGTGSRPSARPPVLTIIPGGPGRPGLPAGPGEPGGPLSPAGPRGPTSPMEPLFPGPPGIPALPFSPGYPLSPGDPASPCGQERLSSGVPRQPWDTAVALVALPGSPHLLSGRPRNARLSWGSLENGRSVTGMSPPWGHPGDATTRPRVQRGRKAPENPTPTSFPTGPSSPCSPCGDKGVVTPRGHPSMSPLLRGTGCVPCCTHRWSRVSRGSRLSWHSRQTPLAHGAALALQPLQEEPGAPGWARGGDWGIPKRLIPSPNPKGMRLHPVLTTPARPAGPGCPGLPGGPWGQRQREGSAGGHR